MPKIKENGLIDKFWVFGGPTPHWGGSLEKDCLEKGCEFFGIHNAFYVYGPSDNEMLDTLKNLKRVACHAGFACRNPGVSSGLIEDASKINALSLQYQNIVGAISDDFFLEFSLIESISKNVKLPGRTPDDLEKMYSNLKKNRPDLKYYTVIYAHQLDLVDYSNYLPYIDAPVLWLWCQSQIKDMEKYVMKCKEVFKGKPVFQGVFMFDYGEKSKPMPLDLLKLQLEKSLELLKADTIQGVVILGDREIKKCPEQAELVRSFLKGI